MKYIAVLEDDERRTLAMQQALSALDTRCTTVFFDNAPAMNSWLREHLQETTLISLDHDLGPIRRHGEEGLDPGTGRDVADYLGTQEPVCPVIVHTSNSMACSGMQLVLTDGGWTCHRVVPFNDLAWIASSWAGECSNQLSRDGGGASSQRQTP